MSTRPNVAELVKSIVIIPGSGEFVYDTLVQYKIIKNNFDRIIAKEAINSHNYYNISNAIHSLNQLQLTCSNITWVAIVACWFRDSLDSAICQIKPAVEFNEKNTHTTEDWKVGKYIRSTAKLISRDKNNNPRYGGSINDASVIRYLQEIKRRGLKIMFYPMFFMDIEGKAWRGHLTGTMESITEFFIKEEGYNNFVLHYANLVKDFIDGFVIGSELIGLTKVKDINNNFPAVNELIKLAKLVKKIVGSKVVVTYGADWSEYHHTNGGWYNLDPLWATDSIDFVGIDVYFPSVHSQSSRLSIEEIILGWRSKEGFDYYYDEENKKHALLPEYAWKNIKYWWENRHRNPDGNFTQWQPKMKKIWFTEFGFPSIDKGTNQPNIFFDPQSIDSGIPKYSTGEVDFALQRKAIRAFIDYWQQEEYIERLFLWTWDARPYPAWPYMDIWQDRHLWEKGHWVNDKFGASSVASILLEISSKCGLSQDKIDVSTLDELVEGFVLNSKHSAIDAINILRIGYFFDILTCRTDKVRFIKRGQTNSYQLSAQYLIKLSENSYFETIEICKSNIISKIELFFINRFDEYNISHYLLNNDEHLSNKRNVALKLPLIMSNADAESLTWLILQNAATETKLVRFIIPITYIFCEPCDFIHIEYLRLIYQIRITEMKIIGLTIEIIGVIDKQQSY